MANQTEILFAGYGVWNSVKVVTGEVRGFIEDAYAEKEHTVSLLAENAKWGGDPSPGNRKYIFCAWRTADGKIRGGVTGENDPHGVEIPTGA